VSPEVIRPSPTRLDSRRKAVLAAEAVRDKHAENLVIMDVRALSGVTDFFVIATAGSPPQLKAMRDAVDETLRLVGHRVEHTEGVPKLSRSAAARARRHATREDAPRYEEALAWVLLDCGSVIVHLLNPPAREFYQLEHLWGDAPRISLDA
jgi:ribosome-associated protein